MDNTIHNILEETYKKIAEFTIENNIGDGLILNEIKLLQNEMWRNAIESVLSQKIMETCFIEELENNSQDNSQDNEQENTSKENTHKSRWPATSKTAIQYKTKMEELLKLVEENPFNSQLPISKGDICTYCEIKTCNLGDFKNWLKTYHNDFYNRFINDFPYFSSRND